MYRTFPRIGFRRHMSFYRYFSQFWNEMVSIVYTDEQLSDMVINDEIPVEVTTNGLSSWWRCTADTFKRRKEYIQADSSSDLLGDLSSILMGSCYIGTFLRASTLCL